MPITEDFKHTSPFGIIEGKGASLRHVIENGEKFLGHIFELHDEIYENDMAYVVYTARQGKDFSLDVSEWYYIRENLIAENEAYYHFGEIRHERKLKSSED